MPNLGTGLGTLECLKHRAGTSCKVALPRLYEVVEMSFRSAAKSESNVDRIPLRESNIKSQEQPMAIILLSIYLRIMISFIAQFLKYWGRPM